MAGNSSGPMSTDLRPAYALPQTSGAPTVRRAYLELNAAGRWAVSTAAPATGTLTRNAVGRVIAQQGGTDTVTMALRGADPHPLVFGG